MPTLSIRINHRLHRIDIDDVEREVNDLIAIVYRKMPADIRALKHLIEREHLDAIRSDYDTISANNERFIAENQHIDRYLMTTPGVIGTLGRNTLFFTILMRTYRENGVKYAANLAEIIELLNGYVS